VGRIPPVWKVPFPAGPQRHTRPHVLSATEGSSCHTKFHHIAHRKPKAIQQSIWVTVSKGLRLYIIKYCPDWLSACMATATSYHGNSFRKQFYVQFDVRDGGLPWLGRWPGHERHDGHHLAMYLHIDTPPLLHAAPQCLRVQRWNHKRLLA